MGAVSASPERLLVVFFSRTGENWWEGGRRELSVGNTARLAGVLADLLGCARWEIRPEDPYPQAYDPTVARNVREQEDDARPGIVGPLPDLSGKDAVLLGTPVWNSAAPQILTTFLEAADLRGRTVLPFATYAVSGMAGIDAAWRRALPGSRVLDGLAVRGERAGDARTEAAQWLRGHGLLR